MKRTILGDLEKWKDRKDRKPLILKGVRQCGKTYILNAFGRTHYSQVAYFNFENNPALAERFESNLDPKRIVMELGILFGQKIDPESTLIIFDEIQFCGKAITALKYFCEQAPEYHIVCAGSLLGISLSKPSSFPVGKVEFLTLRPMSFYEFLLAHDELMLLEYLKGLDGSAPVPTMFVDKLRTLLLTFYVTGGMPEVVLKWVQTRDVAEVDRLQDSILSAYELDFAKHAPKTDFPKLSLIWKSVPDQLAKENGKFIYGHVKPGARAKDFEDALEWLISAGLTHKVSRIEKPGFPLSAYAAQTFFKLFLSDVGLLRRLSRLPAATIFENTGLFTEFKGAMVENFVLTELVTYLGEVPYYWTSGNTAEVDFIAYIADNPVPIEVKASTHTKARSLALYRARYQPAVSVKTSLLNLGREADILSLPLYLMWRITDLAKG